MRRDDVCEAFCLGEGLDIATFFYTEGDASEQDTWDIEVAFLKSITGGGHTAGDCGRVPEVSGDRPIGLLCEYGFSSMPSDKDIVRTLGLP